jgi:hypothetical protein
MTTLQTINTKRTHINLVVWQPSNGSLFGEHLGHVHDCGGLLNENRTDSLM